jgi:hypothetical protein
MNVLYVTDDRAQYRQGYYYRDWLEAFRRRDHVIEWEPGVQTPRRAELDAAELIVIGHGGQDVLAQVLRQGTWARARAWLSGHTAGRDVATLRKLDCPKVILSKNDYKGIAQKVAVCRAIGAGLLVTHSRQSLPEFARYDQPAEWVPFGVDRAIFRPRELERTTDLGFIGNLNDRWNDGIRSRLVGAARAQCADLRLDLRTSENGEGFLFGDEYIAWINRCRLVLNTVSAIGTVGPKWWEEMACGAVPVAPVDEYEGLLEPDVHYVAVQPDCSDLRRQVDRFLTDDNYRTGIQQATREMAECADMDRRYDELHAHLVAHGLVKGELACPRKTG